MFRMRHLCPARIMRSEMVLNMCHDSLEPGFEILF